jgi:hypothetical protein
MTKVWAAKCKSCGELGGVRTSQTYQDKMEIPSPSRTTKCRCLHCGAENEFSDAELSEVEAKILRRSDGPPISHS